MAELEADPGRGVGVRELDDLLPADLLLIAPDPRAAVGDAPLHGDVRGLGPDEAGAADGACAVVHVVPAIRHAVVGAVLAHGGDDHAVRQHDVAGPERREGGERDDVGVTALQLDEAPPRAVHEIRVPQGEVVVGDTLRARHQIEREQDRVLLHVAAGVLEPLQARLGGLLRLEDLDPTPLLIAGQRGGHVRVVGTGTRSDEGVHEGDGVLHRELRAGPDGEVGGVGGVPDQDRLPVHPRCAGDRWEDPPDGTIRE